MKKLICTTILLLLTSVVYASPPTRQFTYTGGNTITASQNTANEDAIFNYLTAGVDTYADNTIVNADINATANVQSDKLNLTAIAQNVGITSAGSFDNNGTSTFDGTVDINGATTLDGTVDLNAKLTAAANEIEGSAFDINGGAIDGVTIGAAAAPTVTDLGTVTTADINGGTLDGVTIGGASAEGEIFYNDGSDDVAVLANGTSGQFLQSQGIAAPVWAAQSITLTESDTITAGTSASFTGLGTTKYYKIVYQVTNTTGDAATAIMQLSGDSNQKYAWAYQATNFNATPTQSDAGVGVDGGTSITIISAIPNANTASGVINIMPTTGETTVSGTFSFSNEGATGEGGFYYSDGDLTSITITFSKNMNGTVTLYEFSRT